MAVPQGNGKVGELQYRAVLLLVRLGLGLLRRGSGQLRAQPFELMIQLRQKDRLGADVQLHGRRRPLRDTLHDRDVLGRQLYVHRFFRQLQADAAGVGVGLVEVAGHAEILEARAEGRAEPGDPAARLEILDGPRQVVAGEPDELALRFGHGKLHAGEARGAGHDVSPLLVLKKAHHLRVGGGLIDHVRGARQRDLVEPQPVVVEGRGHEALLVDRRQRRSVAGAAVGDGAEILAEAQPLERATGAQQTGVGQGHVGPLGVQVVRPELAAEVVLRRIAHRSPEAAAGRHVTGDNEVPITEVPHRGAPVDRRAAAGQVGVERVAGAQGVLPGRTRRPRDEGRQRHPADPTRVSHSYGPAPCLASSASCSRRATGSTSSARQTTRR